MGLIILKRTLISITIWLPQNSLAVHQAILKFTVIILKVGPLEETFTVHVVFLKFSLVNLTIIGEVIFTMALHLSFDELSIVDTSVVRKLTSAILLSVDEFTLVNFGGLLPHFFTLAVLFVVNPRSFVNGSLIVDKSSIPAGLTFDPVALVNITICVGHSSLTVWLATFDLSLIKGAIFIIDLTDTLLAASLGIPVTTVFMAISDTLSSIVPLEICTLFFHKISELLVSHQGALIGDMVNQFLIDFAEFLNVSEFKA